MSVYVIANYTVNDQEKIETYQQTVADTIRQYGGTHIYLIASRRLIRLGSTLFYLSYR